MLCKVIDHETIVAIVSAGFRSIKRRKIDCKFAASEVAWDNRVSQPKLIARVVNAVVLKGERLRRFCHDVCMIDVEEEDQSAFCFHAQSSQLAEGRKDLVGRRDGLVLLSRLPVADVAVNGSTTCRLPEGSIVSQRTLADHFEGAGKMEDGGRVTRTGKTATRACSRHEKLHETPMCDLAWCSDVQPFERYSLPSLSQWKRANGRSWSAWQESRVGVNEVCISFATHPRLSVNVPIDAEPEIRPLSLQSDPKVDIEVSCRAFCNNPCHEIPQIAALLDPA